MKQELRTSKHERGFTLIELAIALTIVALIIGGMAVPLSTRFAEQKYSETQANIDKAVEALIGFAISNRRLPCPDVRTAVADNRDGREDVIPAAGAITGCSAGTLGTQTAANGASWGDLPWSSLGMQPSHSQDAWNNRLRYAVFTPITTQAAVAGVCGGTAAGLSNLFCTTTMATVPDITVALDIRCANPLAPPGAPAPNCLPIVGAANGRYVVATNAVFVVYSHGANAWGSTSVTDVAARKLFLAGTTPNDDWENIPEAQLVGTADDLINARRRFVVRPRTDATSSAGEFDDVLSFVSANTLAAKLLAAGVWP